MFRAYTGQRQPVILIRYPGSGLSLALTGFGHQKPKLCHSAVRRRNSFGRRHSKCKTIPAVHIHTYIAQTSVTLVKILPQNYNLFHQYFNK